MDRAAQDGKSLQKRSFRYAYMSNPLISLGHLQLNPTSFQASGVQVLMLVLETSLGLKVALGDVKISDIVQ